jgi:anti-sigma B factor antagonist
MPNPFSLQKSSQEGISVISIEGYMDAHTAPEFERAIQEEIDAGNVRIVADCSRLTYISSAGFGVFMGFIEEIHEQGGDIKICSLSPKVRQVFEMLGFQELYDICDDLPGAIQKFAKASVKEG